MKTKKNDVFRTYFQKDFQSPALTGRIRRNRVDRGVKVAIQSFIKRNPGFVLSQDEIIIEQTALRAFL